MNDILTFINCLAGLVKKRDASGIKTSHLIFTNIKTFFMKKILMFAVLLLATLSARAALFINNNTTCDRSLYIYASDANLPGPCSYYIWVKVPATSSLAYNNTGVLNAPGYVWRDATIGPSGYITMQTNGTWDAASIAPYPATAEVGRAGSCVPGTVASSTAGCPYTITWTSLGGNNVLVDIN